jgi:hypothetical protein
MRSVYWWVWLLVAVGVWVFHRTISEYLDKIVPEKELGLVWGGVRTVLVTVVFLCLAVGVTFFVKWVRTL